MSREKFREENPKRMVRFEGDGLSEALAEYAEIVNDEPSLTRQSDLDAADINKIAKRFERDGIVPLVKREGVYVDVSDIGDYRSALEQVRRADEYFSDLPAESRAMFDNDPAKFLDALNDPEQLSLLVEAGVIPKDEVVIPKVEVPDVKAEDGGEGKS